MDMHDADGKLMVLGQKVLVLELDSRILESLDPEERAVVDEMLSGPFEVCEFSERYAYVEAGKEFPQGWEFHKFAVPPDKLRIVPV
ncbi:hypothetical protein MMG85_03125 [Pseudoxanthomonas sp. LH2527]|uniref:hypothetical protein n=1 Tax=Pseudoxanthomonas sp. LH2527 TaxID=2923249 RepID=UPI001F13B243|nr:hypothetical protein [Pseudoxanthomonas sp. LH2527]MCH6482565.1 hypothetical protein [Pseudoxanthomonas sp. LH2527]